MFVHTVFFYFCQNADDIKPQEGEQLIHHQKNGWDWELITIQQTLYF